jgi:hypothetical protein
LFDEKFGSALVPQLFQEGDALLQTLYAVHDTVTSVARIANPASERPSLVAVVEDEARRLATALTTTVIRLRRAVLFRRRGQVAASAHCSSTMEVATLSARRFHIERCPRSRPHWHVRPQTTAEASPYLPLLAARRTPRRTAPRSSPPGPAASARCQEPRPANSGKAATNQLFKAMTDADLRAHYSRPEAEASLSPCILGNTHLQMAHSKSSAHSPQSSKIIEAGDIGEKPAPGSASRAWRWTKQTTTPI